MSETIKMFYLRCCATYFACTIYFQFIRPYKILVFIYAPDNDVCYSISWDLNYRQLLQLCSSALKYKQSVSSSDKFIYTHRSMILL